MEGAARSIPSIALSQVYHGKIDWKGVEFAEQGEYNIDGDLPFTENLNGSLTLSWSREHSGSGSINKMKGGFIIITPIK